MEHQPFSYHTLEELAAACKACGVTLPFSKDLSPLKAPLSVYGREIANRLCIQPMEGCDGTKDGRPGELTLRRYRRFAAGGAGLIWLEAAAVDPNGRANPRQLCINRDTVEAMAALQAQIASAAKGAGHPVPFTVLQLTHSGRYSKPQPIIAAQNPYLDRPGQTYKVITDEELDALQDTFVEGARQAKEAGFDAVDVKCCHGYLFAELMGAKTRPGKYGGDFEGRSRMLLTTVRRVKEEAGIPVTVRLNAFDEIPVPYGFGVKKEDFRTPDLAETKELVRRLRALGVELIDVTAGNPYYNPHVNRPYDIGFYRPPVHPLVYVGKMLGAVKELKESCPDTAFLCSALSWLREFGSLAAAGGVKDGWFDLAGFGRQALAYPDFAADLLEQGGMKREKCCIACSKCTELMRDGGTSGCVIRDKEVYLPIYRAGREGKPPISSRQVAEHI